MRRPTVILLNGPGSVGKGSVAAALQAAFLDEPLLHVAMDTFFEMLPARTVGTPDGLQFEVHIEDRHPSVRAFCGPAAERTWAGMRVSTGVLAEAGNGLIIDDVAEASEIGDYRRILQSYSPLFVGLTAPLAVLEERERSRGDRMVGLARWQHERVHRDVEYDLMLDMSAHSPPEAALRIMQVLASSRP